MLREGMITRDLSDILHALRKIRNKAVHENYSSVEKGKALLQMAHSLSEWFMQTYGDWDYQSHLFVMPSENPESVTDDKENEQVKEEKLLKDASIAAEAAPVVARDERKRQAGRAAGLRVRSEAETRYLIDEYRVKLAGKQIRQDCVIPGEHVRQRDAILRLPNGLRILP